MPSSQTGEKEIEREREKDREGAQKEERLRLERARERGSERKIENGQRNFAELGIPNFRCLWPTTRHQIKALGIWHHTKWCACVCVHLCVCIKFLASA